MENNKILDLSYAADEDFEHIKSVLEQWKSDGMIARLYCPSEREIQERMEDVYRAVTTSYNRGSNHALIGVTVGALVAGGFLLAKDYFKYRRRMAEVEAAKPE